MKTLTLENRQAMEAITAEVDKTYLQCKRPVASAHEGLALIECELETLKEEVFLNPMARSHAKMMNQATRVAAWAVRFMLDVTTSKCQEAK